MGGGFVSKSFKIEAKTKIFSLFLKKRLILFYIYNEDTVLSARMTNVKLQIAASSYLLNIIQFV